MRSSSATGGTPPPSNPPASPIRLTQSPDLAGHDDAGPDQPVGQDAGREGGGDAVATPPSGSKKALYAYWAVSSVLIRKEIP